VGSIKKNIPFLKGKKIMIVDDEPDIRSTVKMVLEKNGYAVVTEVQQASLQIQNEVDLARCSVVDVRQSIQN